MSVEENAAMEKELDEYIRKFNTGATRDTEKGKLDYEGFLSPLVLERYARYMHQHRKQSDGRLRESDNWQKGIPFSAYMKSMWRHFFSVWKWHRLFGNPLKTEITIQTKREWEDQLCALLFNVSGYLHELLKTEKRLE